MEVMWEGGSKKKGGRKRSKEEGKVDVRKEGGKEARRSTQQAEVG